MKKVIHVLFLSFISCFCSIGVYADTGASASDKQRFIFYVNQIKTEAKEAGISDSTLNVAFSNSYYLARVIVADKQQPEKKEYLQHYLAKVLTESRINEANKLYKQYHEKLLAVSREYKVQPQYIIALWALESSFGRLQGKEDVISALITLAFDGRRETFFKNELFVLLKMLDENKISYDKLKGSWAGAMGQCQFMPSSLLKYGVDGDGDGQVDIWHNIDDVFSSIANYLSKEGWNNKFEWGTEVQLTREISSELLGIKDEQGKTIQQWQKLGVAIANDKTFDKSRKAWLIIPDDPQKESFLVFDNFRTLMHWNRSYYFALSVGMLADKIQSIK